MEYASGGELFERICNAGRFSEDEVLNARLLCSTLIYCTLFESRQECTIFIILLCCWYRLASSFNNLYLESATAMLWYRSVFPFLLFYNNENLFFPTPAVETSYIQFFVILFLGEANMPSWLEARKHFVGWKPGSSIEDMWLWIFKGTSCVSLSYSLCCQFRGERQGVGGSLS